MYRSVGSDDKEPEGPGRRGVDGPVSEKSTMNEMISRHTSPSQRFFPFLQAVQARAPLFGMWTGGCDEPISAPPISLFVLLRFPPCASEPFEMDADGDKDMLVPYGSVFPHWNIMNRRGEGWSDRTP